MNTQQQKQFKILLIGDDALDVYQYGTVDRISPEAPVPVFSHVYSERRLGMSSNVYMNLTQLGCSVGALHGERSIKTRIVDIKSKQQIVRIDKDTVSEPLKLGDIPYDINSSDAIVISDYDKGYVSYELIENLRKIYKGPIFVDTKKQDLQRLSGCYIKINQLEAGLTTSRPDPQHLIVTMGARGVFWNGYSYKAKQVEVTDACGAGDTFLAALAYEYLRTTDMSKSIEFAIKASTVTVQHYGVYAPTLEEIDAT